MARRTAGIERLRDPKAKRVGTLPNTSAAYFLDRVPDLLSVMVEQEQWLARIDGRQPRDRATMSRLIDYSLLDEIAAERSVR